MTARGLSQVSARYSYFLNVLTVHYYLDIYGMTFTLFISKKFLNLSLPETEMFLHTLILSWNGQQVANLQLSTRALTKIAHVLKSLFETLLKI